MALVIRLPGAGPLAVEHVIRADVHHLDIQLLSAYVHVVLGRIHSRISGTVDHSVHLRFRDHPPAGPCVGDVHLLQVHSHGLQAAFYHFIYHVMAQLALDACY